MSGYLKAQASCALTLLLFTATAVCGETYYVDSRDGRDSNPGTTERAAWKSLARVNATDLRPGDRVLFRSGSRWEGQLAPKGSGTADAPVVIGRYGDGARPRIDGGGKSEDTVRLYNFQHIQLRGLEVTNTGTGVAMRRGVHAIVENTGAAKGIVISGLYVHDVNGTNAVKDSGGIVLRVGGKGAPSWFDGLTVERNIVWKVDRTAIAFPNPNWARTRFRPSLNVIIRDNLVDDIGGDGIVPTVTDHVLVEHNIARNCNRRAGSYNAGIWPWSADDSLFRLNEASFTRTTLDGQGFDSDFNSHRTVFEYNYSHDNEGGFMLICSPGKRNPAENVGNLGTIVRHNISRNDRRGVFQLSAAQNTTIEGNKIYVGPGLDVQMVLFTNWDGWGNGAVFRNNTFHVEGKASYGHAISKKDDGQYVGAPGWGPMQNVVFEGNRYFGTHVDAPADARPEPVATPAGDWDIPVFDPSSPDGFDAFLERHRAAMLKLFQREFPAHAIATK